MSKRGDWVSFNSFRGGEQSDLPPHEIPDDALLKASNVVTDKRGRLAKRGPVQPYLLTQISETFQQVGVSKLNLGNQQPNAGFAVSNDGYYSFSLPSPPSVKRSGAIAGRALFDFTLNSPVWGPSFNSFGLCSFPLRSNNVVAPTVFFGSPTIFNQNSVSSTTGTVSVTANSSVISITSGITINTNLIGKIVYLNNNSASPANEYVGVITGVSAGTSTINVYPAPSKTWSGSGSCQINVKPFQTITGKLFESGGAFNVPASTSFGCVHQNRVVSLSSATTTFAGSSFTSPIPTQNNVISWSAITGESATAANTNADGILAMLVAGWPKSQSLTLDTSGVTGLVSLDANNLLVLCADKTLLISGTLGTVLPAASVNTSSFNLRTVSAEIGCIDSASIQRTPLGVMFAGRDGVYITDGASFTNVMEGKIQQKWTVYNGNNSFRINRVTGSALLKDTHYAVFTENGPHFICDLYNDFSWTELEFTTGLTNYTGIPGPSYRGSFPPASFAPTGSLMIPGEVAQASSTGAYVLTDVNSIPYDQFPYWFNGGSQSSPIYSQGFLSLPANSGMSGVYPNITNDGAHIVLMGYSSALSTIRFLYYSGTGGNFTLKQDFGIGGSSLIGIWDLAKNAGDRLVYGVNSSQFIVRLRSGFTSWGLEATIVPPTSCQNAVISSDGTAIALADISFNSNRGRIYVYRRSGTTWTLNSTLDIPSAAVGSYYGVSMCFDPSASQLLIGPSETTNVSVGLHVYQFSAGVYSHLTQFLPAPGNPGIIRTGIGCDGVGVFYLASPNYRTVYAYTFSASGARLVWQQAMSPNTSTPRGIGATPTGAALYVADGFINYRGPNTINRTGGFHVFDLAADVFAKPIWGVGVNDWSGSSEVYAPRLNAVSNLSTRNAIVLLDSILDTDSYPESDCIDANSVVDAVSNLPFNAAVVTKAFALGDPTQLKAYKSMMMTYEADPTLSGANPVGIRYAESLNPNINQTPPILFYDEAPATLGVETQSHRTSLIPRPIDNGIAFAFNTNYSSANDKNVGNGYFKLYEFFLNVTGLRKGRTIQ